eukprot:CAMPEP_0174837690 /NCGR_PEP_ID=MMETSP1114-20130205/6913_1 /TAXON_ID=312471 /ORGANISM="Neobodo designis, Strain CCAP 1951/1" /LENGTH=114 /DNA_ID=CAMNT_0016071763 /DNA_START=599 /DNA_END=944 /DNA_ORIENTATION=+
MTSTNRDGTRTDEAPLGLADRFSLVFYFPPRRRRAEAWILRSCPYVGIFCSTRPATPRAWCYQSMPCTAFALQSARARKADIFLCVARVDELNPSHHVDEIDCRSDEATQPPRP